MTTPVQQLRSRQAGYGSVGLLLVLLVILSALILGLVNRQNLYDWLKLRNYHPSAAVIALAEADTMTAYATKVYEVNHPAIDSKATFAPACPSGTEQTVVLGCYHSDQDGIYLLSVTDPKLNGVEQVTAAHETLHAIYDRLSSAKRTQVNDWLMDYYQNDLHDQTILSQINAYKKTEPTALVDEMHSILGSEVGNLSPQLETYYQQYFTNRAAIVADYSQYQAAFTDRQNTIKQDDVQLGAWKNQIDSGTSDLKRRQAALSSEQQTLDREKSSNAQAYNAGVPGYNRDVDAYNAEAASVGQLVKDYNQLVEARNALALEEQQLVQDLSGSVSNVNN